MRILRPLGVVLGLAVLVGIVLVVSTAAIDVDLGFVSEWVRAALAAIAPGRASAHAHPAASACARRDGGARSQSPGSMPVTSRKVTASVRPGFLAPRSILEK